MTPRPPQLLLEPGEAEPGGRLSTGPREQQGGGAPGQALGFSAFPECAPLGGVAPGLPELWEREAGTRAPYPPERPGDLQPPRQGRRCGSGVAAGLGRALDGGVLRGHGSVGRPQDTVRRRSSSRSEKTRRAGHRAPPPPRLRSPAGLGRPEGGFGEMAFHRGYALSGTDEDNNSNSNKAGGDWFPQRAELGWK